MSVIFGIKEKEVIIVAGDRRASAIDGAFISDEMQKVVAINDWLCMASAGSVAIEKAIIKDIEASGNPHSEESVRFFKIVQNKLHYAAHGHTAAEVIYQRADAEKPFMGLTSFSGELPALKDIGIAKNYLEENELKVLNNLVSGYFDLAEINAIEHKPMYMDDYVKQLDSVLSSGNRKLLTGSGSVSHKQALEKAKSEYRKYQEITLTPVEKAYLESIKEVSKEVKRR